MRGRRWHRRSVCGVCQRSFCGCSKLPRDLDGGRIGSSVRLVWGYNLAMPHTYEEVQQLARALPEDERIRLANSLWEGAEGVATEAEIAAAREPEIACRVAQIKAGTAVTYSLAEVEADLRAVTGRGASVVS